MTATDELRKLLDERGVEWESDGSGFRVMWGQPVSIDQMQFKAVDNALPNGGLNISICGFSPEQAIAATLGERSNTEYDGVTAEQVMAIVGRHQPDYCSDTHVCFDWQAIADELNATLGAGTCHIMVQDNINETEGMGDVWLECDACYWQMPLEPSTPRFNFCPNCGAKVVDE